ncbi:Serine/threonine-protein phosphatase 2B catalytic subunit alpha, variant 2 [Bonamia ostreae]|uniref:Serine/threonine-protein phosphatase n=1 Tax=Bonamia ostreae TaxID=126728 RepID=A0ABV2AQW1_9EUKA
MAIFEKEKNVLRLGSPVVVFGDVHGQFYDLSNGLKKFCDFGRKKTLFLGDYVDRGCFSCECILLLFCLKIKYPRAFFLLRGNHETRKMTNYFNFKDECVYKYSLDVYNDFMKVFDRLPLCAIIDDKYFCLHGGLSPDILSVLNLSLKGQWNRKNRESR